MEQGPKRTRQRAYLSEQTDGSVPNLLMAVNVELARPRTATADHLLAFTGAHVGRVGPQHGCKCCVPVRQAPSHPNPN